jgi:oligopeptide transport system substrate-binding protein
MRHSDIQDGFTEDQQVLRIACPDDFPTTDPRLVRDLPSRTMLNLLYEGLVRLNSHGKVENAIAENISLSPDLMTYTFKLRKSQWSNGDPLTAKHFEDTWKSILNPTFPAPNAYQFFLIKNAKKVKEGLLPESSLGIHATDDSTLVVELEYPAPYFLELLATHFFYPFHPSSTAEKPIGNGPFTLTSRKRNDRLSFAKNSSYWESKEVHLDGVVLLVLDNQTALRMFEKGELDWVGSPMGTLPTDALPFLKHQHQLLVSPAAGVHWFRFNTEKTPFNNRNMRKAFTLAINREHLVKFVTQGNQKTAESIVPPSFGLEKTRYFNDDAVPEAWYAFQEALEEMKISKDDLPKITLCYANAERNHKVVQAVQQQWKIALGVEVALESLESKILFDRLSQADFQMASGGWYADFRDPINFLNVFKSKSNPSNNTQWENQTFSELLTESNHTKDHSQRLQILSKAQGILMDEYPVAPLFFGSFNYLKTEGLLGVYVSDLGYLDFKYAFFSK